MSGTPARNWELWIDVGGTFTDCVGRRPTGELVTHKLLSTGAYKLEVLAGSTRSVLRVAMPPGAPERFFDGFGASLLAPASMGTGNAVLEHGVAVRACGSTDGRLELDRPLGHEPRPGMILELASGEEAPVTGIRWLLGKRLDEPVGPVLVRLGTTRGTNALLERRGARVGFVTTAGFADVLAIAYQNRPRLFDLSARKARPLHAAVAEIDERIDARGRVLRAPSDARVREALAGLARQGIDALAVCLLNAHRNPRHEQLVAAVARSAGFGQVSVSSELSPLQRIVPRGNTTVVDAYLTPVIREYVARIRAALPEATLKLMTSAGGLVDAAAFVGKDSIYSGPAGGAVGVAAVAAEAGLDKAIGLDMGGTSTDVCRYDAGYEYRYEMELCAPGDESGVRITAPMLAVETVAAGGGSICSFDGARLRVGPRSAGADPGPACYGRGGPLTLTDVNLLLGRLLPRHFPFPLDTAAVEARVEQLRADVRRDTGRELSRDELLAGFLELADTAVIAPIRKISLARGYDVRDYGLVSFGGAGGQHACRVADELGIRRIVHHPYASLLSAYGIGLAEVRVHAASDLGRPYSDETLALVTERFAGMLAELRDRLAAEGVGPDACAQPVRLLDLRYAGQETALTIREPNDGDWPAAFAAAHERLYGFTLPGRALEVRVVRLELASLTQGPTPAVPAGGARRAVAAGSTPVRFHAGWREAPLYERGALRPGDWLEGPALVVEPTTIIVVEQGWRGELAPSGSLVLERVSPATAAATRGEERFDPVQIALFHHRFALVAEEMGVTLQKAALSVNVKERLDFSCAVFAPDGSLVVNAPHIPVHLGAMGATVAAVIQAMPEMRPGDVFVTNDPYLGGSHLPDVTVLTPVFDAAGHELLFFTGNRAHHAEMGGITPGSMSPFGHSLADEGVLIRPRLLVRDGRIDEEGLRRLLSEAPHPSRAVEENLADIRAQVAANELGRRRLLELVARHGTAAVQAQLRHIQQAAEQKMRRALAKLAPGDHRFTDRMDDGTPIAVRVGITHSPAGGEAVVDFEGTGPVSAASLNANPAIVRAAVLYALRCLVDEDVPLNDGFLAPVRIVVPRDCLLRPAGGADPSELPAVVAGNVETSQRVVDVILGALGAAAASQGTMNNVLFGRGPTDGTAGFAYYETICGGAGAGLGFDGESAVHTHMTNTRITDPEVLEERYPVRLRRFAVRRGSGGAGRHRGGDGVVREIEALEPLEVSLLTSRRSLAPYGMAGGGPGAPGRNLVRRAGAAEDEQLEGMAAVRLGAGDVLRIETPGGGGYGFAAERREAQSAGAAEHAGGGAPGSTGGQQHAGHGAPPGPRQPQADADAARAVAQETA